MKKLLLIPLAVGALYIPSIGSTVYYPDRPAEHYWVPGEIVHAQAIEIPTTPATVPQAESKPGPGSSVSLEDVKALVARYAAANGVRPGAMLDVIDCEAAKNDDGTYNPQGQSGFSYKGHRENSWGIAQINLDAHQDVSKAQAEDPEFAVRFMAEQFAAGNAHLWTCWRLQH